MVIDAEGKTIGGSDMDVGKNIRNLRLEHDMSMKDLAAKLGVADSAICRWENNQAKLTLDMAVKIADLFGIPMEELVR